MDCLALAHARPSGPNKGGGPAVEPESRTRTRDAGPGTTGRRPPAGGVRRFGLADWTAARRRSRASPRRPSRSSAQRCRCLPARAPFAFPGGRQHDGDGVVLERVHRRVQNGLLDRPRDRRGRTPRGRADGPLDAIESEQAVGRPARRDAIRVENQVLVVVQPALVARDPAVLLESPSGRAESVISCSMLPSAPTASGGGWPQLIQLNTEYVLSEAKPRGNGERLVPVGGRSSPRY
jgi:hypothetical protein